MRTFCGGPVSGAASFEQSVGLLAALAWTGATEDALAGPARPSARGLAETSIQVVIA